MSLQKLPQYRSQIAFTCAWLNG